MHEEYPPVERLTVHLPNDQLITFDPNAPPEVIQARLNALTTLIGVTLIDFSYYFRNLKKNFFPLTSVNLN